MALDLSKLDHNELRALVPATALRKKTLASAMKSVEQDLMDKGVSLPGLSPVFPEGVKVSAKLSANVSRRRAKAPFITRLRQNITNEIYKLICTKDEVYDEVRKKAEKYTNQTTTALIVYIAGVVAAGLGIGVAVCIPFVAVLLLYLGEVGKNTFCKTVKAR